MGVQASALNVTGSGAVVAAPCTFRGCSIRDTTGSANTVKIYDNASAASGTVLLAVELAGDASVPPLAIPAGVRAVNGLFLETTGAVEGSVWIG